MALPGSLVGESQLRIPNLEPDIIFPNRVPLVSVDLEYHAEWYALKSSSIRDGGNDQLRVSQRGRDGQLLCCFMLPGEVDLLVNQGE